MRARVSAALRGPSLGVLLLSVGACFTSQPPPPPGPTDGGSGWDGGLSRRDPDGDGLCTARELELGSDPERADTDGDGLPDGVEFVAATGPINNRDPAPDQVAWLQLQSGASASLLVTFEVRGRGESFHAALEGPRSVPGAEGSVHDYFAGLVAVGAFPPETAAEVDPDAAAMRGVVGRALLTFEVRFRPSEQEVRDCAQAYPFRVVLKREDGAQRPSAPLLLVVGPRQSVPWCPWGPACL